MQTSLQKLKRQLLKSVSQAFLPRLHHEVASQSQVCTAKVHNLKKPIHFKWPQSSQLPSKVELAVMASTEKTGTTFSLSCNSSILIFRQNKKAVTGDLWIVYSKNTGKPIGHGSKSKIQDTQKEEFFCPVKNLFGPEQNNLILTKINSDVG